MVIFQKQLFGNRILTLSLLVLTMLLVTLWTCSLVAQEKKIVLTQKTELAELNRDLGLLDRLLVDHKNTQEKLETAAKTLPQSFQDVAYVIAQIERIANGNGQTLETKVGETVLPEQNNLVSLKVTLKTSGTYASFSQMLTDLAHLPYHTQVDSLQIEEGKEMTNQVDFRLYLAKESK